MKSNIQNIPSKLKPNLKSIQVHDIQRMSQNQRSFTIENKQCTESSDDIEIYKAQVLFDIADQINGVIKTIVQQELLNNPNIQQFKLLRDLLIEKKGRVQAAARRYQIAEICEMYAQLEKSLSLKQIKSKKQLNTSSSSTQLTQRESPVVQNRTNVETVQKQVIIDSGINQKSDNLQQLHDNNSDNNNQVNQVFDSDLQNKQEVPPEQKDLDLNIEITNEVEISKEINGPIPEPQIKDPQQNTITLKTNLNSIPERLERIQSGFSENRYKLKPYSKLCSSLEQFKVFNSAQTKSGNEYSEQFGILQEFEEKGDELIQIAAEHKIFVNNLRTTMIVFVK
ncbi:Hypothetical_protein [Hexamita inflata]|uniref:Hypothetical_protein n=1 Tax=Hexamita inflata TaxID=28002 RepID=A0AA86NXL3_9EUKA|nr:Hypothetical protein HINF_LOCUS15538 [Hexamita inflata]